MIKKILTEYGTQIPTIYSNEAWLREIANKVNLNNQEMLSKCEELEKILTYYREHHNLLGISSSNVHWNQTQKPIRVIQVPSPKDDVFITLVNPEIEYKTQETYKPKEGCAALPRLAFLLERCKHVRLTGLDINKYQIVDLNYDTDEEKLFVVQHEIDHLEGILVSDIGEFLGEVN